MQIQKSFQNNDQGKLYIVPTPIGNLEDITFRALTVLKSAGLIAAEDTRHTQKLLNHFDIKNKLISYHEHNRAERIPKLLALLEEGAEIALVSDAGMPAISDPGYELVEAAIARDISVITLPGANAALCALVSSGLPTATFLFVGFLPRKKQEKRAALTQLKNNTATLLFYESPHRIVETLAEIEAHFGNRKIALARELTKLYEEYIRGTIMEVQEWVRGNPVKGECVLIVDGATGDELDSQADWWLSLSIEEHVGHYEKIERVPHKEALKLVARDRNISRRDVYKQIHVQNKKDNDTK